MQMNRLGHFGSWTHKTAALRLARNTWGERTGEGRQVDDLSEFVDEALAAADGDAKALLLAFADRYMALVGELGDLRDVDSQVIFDERLAFCAYWETQEAARPEDAGPDWLPSFRDYEEFEARWIAEHGGPYGDGRPAQMPEGCGKHMCYHPI